MRLSVVVTVVDGGVALERCLAALSGQRNAPSLEVIVPVDDTLAAEAALASRYPAVRFLPLGTVPTVRPRDSVVGQHELFDRRRAVGLAAATGELVAIIEDRGTPEPDWAAEFDRLHAELPHAVLGGAVVPGRSGALARAVFNCDFARYTPPFTDGPREFLTDVNVCYKRTALEQTRDLWQGGYHETVVHDSIRRAGGTLWLAAAPRVREERDGLSLGRLMKERFGWGRQYAATVARESSLATRLVRVARAPLVPLVMTWRILRGAARRGELGSTIVLVPLVLLLLGSWSAGEAAGMIYM